jgi:hypothetical protein
MKIVIITASIITALAFTSAHAQDLTQQPTSEIVAQISYLEGIKSPIALTNIEALSIREAVTQIGVCNELSYEEFSAIAMSIGNDFEAPSGGLLISIQSYESRAKNGCNVTSANATSAANLMKKIQIQNTVSEQLFLHHLVLHDRLLKKPANGGAIGKLATDILNLPTID